MGDASASRSKPRTASPAKHSIPPPVPRIRPLCLNCRRPLLLQQQPPPHDSGPCVSNARSHRQSSPRLAFEQRPCTERSPPKGRFICTPAHRLDPRPDLKVQRQHLSFALLQLSPFVLCPTKIRMQDCQTQTVARTQVGVYQMRGVESSPPEIPLATAHLGATPRLSQSCERPICVGHTRRPSGLGRSSS